MLNEVPNGWRATTLSQLAHIVLGQSPKSDETNDKGIGLPFFQGNAEFGDRYPEARRWSENGPRTAEQGDILISVRAPVGELNLAARRCFIGRGLGAIRATAVDAEFLLHALRFSVPQLQSLSQGSTFDAINRGDLSKLEIALPPRHEQRRIAEILSSVNDAISATQALIEQTRKVKQGVLERLLTKGIGHARYQQTKIGEIPEAWKVVELQDIASVRTGLAKNKKEVADTVELPYLRVANVQDGYIDLSDIQTIRVSRSQIERYSLRKGDVLMTEGGDYDKLGRGDVWNAAIDPCLHQNHVFAVRPDQHHIFPEFLAVLTASRDGKAYFQSCSKRTTNLASINSTQVKQFPVRLPELNEQSDIIAAAKNFDDTASSLTVTLDKQLRLKSALMSDLLTGRKRVTEALPMAAE